jgi:hypothetical protein
LLKTWDLNNNISIERGLKEYGNPDISHNVEYSLHPIINEIHLSIKNEEQSITSNAILKVLETNGYPIDHFTRKYTHQLLSKDGILRNACTIASSHERILVSSIKSRNDREVILHVYEQHSKPFAIFECKRVGVEEGMKKGPQTIEKAKQGAYVARSTSSLQKIRTETGELYGIIYKSDSSFYIKPYIELLEEIIQSNSTELLRRFILTVGVVSNHGNWFTSENQNKELRVLSQSYDWLLFLSDRGLSDFIDKLLLHPIPELLPVKEAFLSSYSATKKKNQFTKVQMNINADEALRGYFASNIADIESWFNIISPDAKNITTLKRELSELKSKKWTNILT